MGLYFNSRFLKRFFAAVDRSQNCAGVLTGALGTTRKMFNFLTSNFDVEKNVARQKSSLSTSNFTSRHFLYLT